MRSHVQHTRCISCHDCGARLDLRSPTDAMAVAEAKERGWRPPRKEPDNAATNPRR
jgi:hypothetical protein